MYWLNPEILLIMMVGCESADISRLNGGPTQLSAAEVAGIVKQFRGLNLSNKPLTDGEPKCKPGLEYERESGYCVDINECQRGTHNCSHVALCVNHAGSFECNGSNGKQTSCPPGYRFNWHINECLEIDECVKKPCARKQMCVDQLGGFKCLEVTQQDCPHGYVYQHRKGCVDINECEKRDANFCDSRNELCKNTHGSYMCVPQCKKGFRMIPNIWDCADIDECLEETDTCAQNEECVNTWGGYNCEMPSNLESFPVQIGVPGRQQQQRHQNFPARSHHS